MEEASRHCLLFPALISLAFQVTHSCHIIARSLEISVLRCRPGNWDPDDFAKDWCLLSWVIGRWSSWLSSLCLVSCCIHEDAPTKKAGLSVRLKFKLGFLLSKDRFELQHRAVILAFLQSQSQKKKKKSCSISLQLLSKVPPLVVCSHRLLSAS